MVSITAVRDNNCAIPRLYGSNLVAVFVGGTSGIGESTARAFIRNTTASRAYLIGRDQTRASRIIDELRQIKPDSRIEFIKADVSLLREVDEVCKNIKKEEDRLNLLFLSPGTGALSGRDDTSEGLDKKLTLHYYARMRFVANLLPQLVKAGEEQQPHRLSRVVSVLEAGGEAALHLDDLSLETHYSLRNCAKHAITMNSVAMEHLAALYPQTSFVHSFPGVVRTRLDRDLSGIARSAMSTLIFLARPWEISFEESGERHLYAATSLRFASQMCGDKVDAAEGSNGMIGSGFYRLDSTGSTYKPSRIMQVYREQGVRGLIWDHTLCVFERVRGGFETWVMTK
ncbi:uncharacterized protein LDX57_008205 [Aspergillus melleus]|uniref:uncharacterized protein n=1 Tax=Aspergillus melleus TaxID=138277 RepID=UPI001E8ECF45|nr:uncharacterized protein LDX57_008205 [Aspergillus melleus]KAH8430541.1 hypothetical protein LDX57_008205 [Aspergillus melleus]